ncbi:bifunctional diaminohydroxyphosphoribosylaminopyrimidine deaminase/5-amino-6-(5-phosphoribosylamino)uracil reductase RibD [Enterobacteriaceae endosymbiont of Macroplea appendiculata]|uniref:bifunctional diaminohydroxyphosphoribosylaminopyrimidine deaminase/5-amino-6-(5-phosphoribosylamino)uracil reductase RibD n=1 Tax=Enterobacteriaceae endosymbiont of Macroplea appendiculata TaxID=2675790 RepID=UPI001449ABA2|nr:bifunctional diaminohydroxyphosphoribosylaminopyrimidine deaminase/5-amino-6-(5-phosphoribosylamino)uracil reductase RibD [Enterobacteriaceae endosymbiont of Macroplea appendiculata]QJC30675.1 bifunctional diaminohydroxyphosphoribosylaminopyrimidine deaminase/5-amino-6-(5-phosphoribosylamino)uracil reductase RibD [Enterobacteriaceae endosymbiont of Macroplea appendiculata]
MYTDKFFMMQAINLAKLGIYTTTPNPNVGCIIVKNNNVIGKGYHFKTGEQHAEVNALKMAGSQTQNSTVYTTLEPCNYYHLTPSCCHALIKAKIYRIVIANIDPNPRINGKSIKMLEQHGIKTTINILSEKAKRINYGFFKRILFGMPYIKLKLASSIDGKIALYNGLSKWISSLKSRQDVHKLRAQSSAILSTSKTILKDNATLIVNWYNLSTYIQKKYPKKFLRQPIRIILDQHNKISPYHKIISIPETIILIKNNINYNNWPKHVTQMIIPIVNGYFNIKLLLQKLATKGINNLLVEAGSILSGYLILNNLIDELIIYMSPQILGPFSLNLCNWTKIYNINDAPKFRYIHIRKIAQDLKIVLKPVK